MSLEFLREWGPFVFTLFGNGLLAWLGTKFASRRAVEEALGIATKAHHRLDLMEKDLKALPNYDVTNRLDDGLRKLEIAVTGLTAEVSGMGEKADMRSAAIGRIEDYLLNGRGAGR